MSLTNEASYITHLDIVSSSAVIVARHSSLLASSIFMPPGECCNLFQSPSTTPYAPGEVCNRFQPPLTTPPPPGSMLLEILPFKWEWHKISMLYYNMTQVWIGMDVDTSGW